MADNNDALVKEVQDLTKDVRASLPKADAAQKAAEEAKALAEKTNASLITVTKDIADIKGSAEEKAKAEAENQKALNQLIVEMKTMRESGLKVKDAGGPGFQEQFVKLITENHKDIAEVVGSHKWTKKLEGNAQILTKGVTPNVMTTATDLSGSPVVTFMPKPALLPGQKINFRDLVNSFQSSTLTINLFRESNPTPAQGNFGQQLTEGATKNLIEYNYANVSFTASYIAGYVRFAKQMMYNLPWLQTYLPQQLIRDFYIKENAIFYAQLIAAAVGSTTTTDGGVAGRLIQVIANIEGTNFTVNGIVVTPAVWAALMLTTVPSTGTAYSVPGGVQIMPNGQMMIAGIPIIKANWVVGPNPASPVTTYALLGDFENAAIAQVENLNVQFFEQDSDNVEKNLITCRVEALEVLVIERPEAFASKLTTGNS